MTPTTWEASTNVVWKQELLGLGSSSTIVVGEKISSTCYTCYGPYERDTGDPSALVRHVFAFNLKTSETASDKVYYVSRNRGVHVVAADPNSNSWPPILRLIQAFSTQACRGRPQTGGSGRTSISIAWEGSPQ